VETYEKASDTDPVVPASNPGRLALTGWQASTMHRQLASGRGYVGRDLDALTVNAASAVPVSVVLAAWISAAQTPSANLARELMGDQDWEDLALDIVYPDAVLTLFVNDIASDAAGAGGGEAAGVPGTGATPALFAGSAPAGPLTAAGGICSDMVDFLGTQLDNIVSALQVQVAEEGALSVLATIWNTVVSIAASAAKIAIGAFTSALLVPITKAMTVVAVLTSAATLLDPWAVVADVAPADSLAPGTDASVTAHVNAAVEFAWPADVVDCAQTLSGVTLPDPGSAKDSPVDWTFVADAAAAVETHRDTVVDAAGDAVLTFSTPPEEATDGVPVVYPVLIGMTVERAQIDKITDLVDTIVLGALPKPALEIVQQLLGPKVGEAKKKLAELVSVAGPVSDIQSIRHEPNPDEGELDDCAAEPGVVPDGKWQGPIKMTVTGKGLKGQAFSGGNGYLRMVVKKGKVTTGTWKVTWHSTGTGSEGGVSAKIEIDGAIHGPVAGTAATPKVTGNFVVSGSAVVNVSGVTQAIPLSFSGTDTEHMEIESTSCDLVTGTFLPSFNSKSSEVSFSGTARWTGEADPAQ
jgi:hypothetical protein